MHYRDQYPELKQLKEDVLIKVEVLAEELLTGKSLGASRNIRQITDLLYDVAKVSDDSDCNKLIQNLVIIGDFFVETRGKNTPAIGNAIRWVLREIENMKDTSVYEVRSFVQTRREAYNAQSIKNVNQIAEYGANLLAGYHTILAFDYSSSMASILTRLAERGLKKRIIVPESRSIDGGRPIAREASKVGHNIEFIVDMAFTYYLKEVQAVLFGVETFLSNGDGWNTVGSFPIAYMAKAYGIPCYVATELIKIDPKSYVGKQKSIKHHDYSGLLNYPSSFEHADHINVIAPDLESIPHEYLSAYITPSGVMLPEHLWHEAKTFLESIGSSLI